METSTGLFDSTLTGHITFAQCEAEKEELFSLSNKELLTYFLLLAICKSLMAAWKEEAFWEKFLWKIPQGYALTGLFYFGCRAFITRGLAWPYGHFFTISCFTGAATVVTIWKMIFRLEPKEKDTADGMTYDFVAKRQKGQNKL